MLLELRVENLALIDRLSLEFRPGLNVLTGETGAGKSIILGALELLIGGRASADRIRSGAQTARVEAALDLDLPSALRDQLADAGVPIDPNEPLLLARQIGPGGRSRAYINGRLVTTALLRMLGESWIDIHGQHEHQSLFRVETHGQLLDAFAGHPELVARMEAAYRRVQTLRQSFRQLQDELRQALQERELLEFQLQELSAVQLQPEEEESLERERKRLLDQQRVAEALEAATVRLSGGEETAAAAAIQDVLAALRPLVEMDPSWKATTERLEALAAELEDLARTLQERRERLEYRPDRLAEIDVRLGEIWRLKQKYRADVPELLRRREEIRTRLEFLTAGAAQLQELREQLRQALREAGRLAFQLSERRRQAAEAFSQRVQAELSALGMAQAVFPVAVIPQEDAAGLIRRAGKGYNLQEYGIDRVEFLFAPNPGEQPRPLRRIASGGEIARVMLAVKQALIEVDPVPVLVFDEVDAGIGGETAHRVGAKLARLAQRHQVLCVTHLPQIAALADHHIRVEKRTQTTDGETRTYTVAVPLDESGRIAELARMLGGESRAARILAEQLLKAPRAAPVPGRSESA